MDITMDNFGNDLGCPIASPAFVTGLKSNFESFRRCGKEANSENAFDRSLVWTVCSNTSSSSLRAGQLPMGLPRNRRRLPNL